ncbi:MAG: glutamine-hydrolyzing carbamoyl-phosphate synthase small subunit [Phycisphaerales bacterium]
MTETVQTAEPVRSGSRAVRLRATLVLEDGTRYRGWSFGAKRSMAGEVVFNTGMVGYVESLTDPSYRGQILVSTYPLVGNYGVPREDVLGPYGLSLTRESYAIHAAGLVVADYSEHYSHWNAAQSLESWLEAEDIPGITGIDTRALTQRLRERGSMLGKIEVAGEAEIEMDDPNQRNLVEEVSIQERATFGTGDKRVLLIDTGAKYNIIRSLADRGATVTRVPWDADLTGELDQYDGLMLSNGPGDPTTCVKTIETIRKAIGRDMPVFGICLGNQLLSLAIGAKTYKLKYGHRGQNQPVIECGTSNCYVTSQNHGFAVDTESLPEDWRPWFENLNDRTNEGIRHAWKPFRSVQFHPEACPGPVDTAYLFDEFLRMLSK